MLKLFKKKEKAIELPCAMKCGHIVNATYCGRPYCIRCNCFETVDMTHRKAYCRYCGLKVKSHVGLPLFELDIEHDEDTFVCWECL